jgi:hypothetical protein
VERVFALAARHGGFHMMEAGQLLGQPASPQPFPYARRQ